METIGQKFKAARAKKKLTLSRAASLTRIKVQHLELMEADDFSKMPAPTYAKGFIRIYSELLGIDSEPLVREYVEKHLRPDAGSAASQAHSKKVRAERKAEGQVDFGSLEIMKQLKRLTGQVSKKLQTLAPRLPQVVATVVAVFVLVGMVRCAVRVAGEGDEVNVQQSLLDTKAMMKEPTAQYVEIPTTEDESP